MLGQESWLLAEFRAPSASIVTHFSRDPILRRPLDSGGVGGVEALRTIQYFSNAVKKGFAVANISSILPWMENICVLHAISFLS